MTTKNRTLEGKNWTLGGNGGPKIVGRHLWMIPKAEYRRLSPRPYFNEQNLETTSNANHSLPKKHIQNYFPTVFALRT